MPRRRVTRLRKLCGLVAGHAGEQAERATQAATALLSALLPDGQVLDMFQFQVLLAQVLDGHRADLTAIDNRHMHELQLDRNLREERDSANAELRQSMIQLKDCLNGLFGAGGANKIFEEAAVIPTDPVALHQLTGHVRDNLADEEFPMPQPLKRGFTLDRMETVRDLDGPFERLGEALRRLDESSSASKFTQARKDEDVAGVDRFAHKAARYLEAFYALIGLDGLATRVRRSSHRADNDEPDGPDGDDTDDTAAETGSLVEPDIPPRSLVADDVLDVAA